MRARELPTAEPSGEITVRRSGAARTVARAATDDTRVAPGRPGLGGEERDPGVRGRNTRGRDPAAPDSGGPLILDRYRLQRRLGAGAFGTVWQAHDERLHRHVAVKLLPRERIAGGRFEREARAAARLGHPGIVTLYEAAIDDDGAYLVSELVRGTTLDRLLEQGRLSDRDIVTIGVALCDALAHAHEQGVVHRDVKPSNILIPRRPTTPEAVAKLTDFGVARVIGGNPLTRTGDVLGTAAYMAPEQAEGRPADQAADLYSLALVLYEALTGVNPLANAPRTRRLGTYLPPLRRQRRELPRALGQAIDQALRPRAGERGTLEELRAALERCKPELGERVGVVEAPSLRRRVDRTRAVELGTRPRGKAAEPPSRPADAASAEPENDLATPPPPVWAARALAGATAAGLAAWLAGHVLPNHPVTPAAAALIAGLLVAALPRLGWIGLTAATTAFLATNNRPGAALLIAIVAALPIVIAPQAPSAWPLPAIAPALGVVGLAGAWPALAARARTVPRRATLGAAGWVALLLATALTHKALYTKLSTPPPSHWTGSASATSSHVLTPLITASTLTAAVIWALAAAVLPLIRATRPGSVALAGLVAWAIATAVATTVAVPAILPGMAALGAIAAVVFTLAPDVTRRLRQPTRGGDLRSMDLR